MSVCFIYLRVSTSSQADAGNGLEAQRQSCLSYAERNGLEVSGVFVDAAVSGAAEIGDRPALMDAINSLQKGSVLLVAKRDRIARDVLNNAVIEKMGSGKKSSLVSADGAGNGDDPSARLMRDILSAMAAYERALVSCRTSAALASMKASGKAYTNIPPFGFKRSACGGLFIEEQREQEILQDVLQWRAQRETWRSCCERLNQEQRLNRAQRPWSVQNLSTVVRRSRAA